MWQQALGKVAVLPCGGSLRLHWSVLDLGDRVNPRALRMGIADLDSLGMALQEVENCRICDGMLPLKCLNRGL